MINLRLLLFQIKYGSANKKGGYFGGKQRWSLFVKRIKLKGYSKGIYKFTAFNMTLLPQNVLDSDRGGIF